MHIKSFVTLVPALFLATSTRLFAAPPLSTSSIPAVEIHGGSEMMTVSTWRICGPFVLPKDQGLQHYSVGTETTALNHDYLPAIGGSESPLVLGPATTSLKVDFTIDVKNQVKTAELPPLPYKPFVDQIQTFPSGVVSSQSLYWGFPRNFAMTYAAANLHAKHAKDVVFVVGANSPVKIWLNGAVLRQPAPGSVGRNWSDYYVIRVKLHAGTNPLLVKMYSFPDRNDFSFHIGTVAQANQFLRDNPTYVDVLDRIAVPQGTPLPLSENLEYLARRSSRLTILDSRGKAVRSGKIDLTNTHEIQTTGLPDGLYDLQIGVGSSTYAESFFVGDIPGRLTEYKSYCDKSGDKSGVPCAVLKSLQNRTVDSQMTLRLDKEKPLLLLMSQFEWNMQGNEAANPLFADSRHVYLESYRSASDSSTQYYFMHLPPAYFHQDRVPLVIFCPYNHHRKDFFVSPTNTMAPVLEEYAAMADKFGFAFIVPYARGVGMSNPKGLQDVVEAQADMLHKYKIDASRIYLEGDCAGGRGALLLAEHDPRGFAAVSTLNAATGSWYAYDDDDGGASDDDDDPVDDGLFSHAANLAQVPILLIHGDFNPHTPISGAYKFKERCAEKGFDPPLMTVPGDGTFVLRDPVYLEFSFFADKRLPSQSAMKNPTSATASSAPATKGSTSAMESAPSTTKSSSN